NLDLSFHGLYPIFLLGARPAVIKIRGVKFKTALPCRRLRRDALTRLCGPNRWPTRDGRFLEADRSQKCRGRGFVGLGVCEDQRVDHFAESGRGVEHSNAFLAILFKRSESAGQ